MFEFIFDVLGFNSYDNNYDQYDNRNYNYYSSREENFRADFVSIVSVLLVLIGIALVAAYFLVPSFHLLVDTYIHRLH